MLELWVTDLEPKEYKAILPFLEYVDIEVNLVFNTDEFFMLNQGKMTPLLMKDDMIVARGFYGIVEYVKSGEYYENS